MPSYEGFIARYVTHKAFRDSLNSSTVQPQGSFAHVLRSPWFVQNKRRLDGMASLIYSQAILELRTKHPRVSVILGDSEFDVLLEQFLHVNEACFESRYRLMEDNFYLWISKLGNLSQQVLGAMARDRAHILASRRLSGDERPEMWIVLNDELLSSEEFLHLDCATVQTTTCEIFYVTGQAGRVKRVTVEASTANAVLKEISQ